MRRRQKYVIECRDENGKLDFKGRQPADVFGERAITGITDNQMSDVIFRHVPDAVMTGDSISLWPRLIDSRWTARQKSW